MENNDFSKDHGHGNFSLGLVAGILAGATGFFLTKTDEGKEIKKKISKEWETIKQKLEEDGVITGNEPNISEIISGAREKIFNFLDEEIPKKKRGRGRIPTKNVGRGRKSKLIKSSSNKNDKAAKTSTKRKKMFKGV
jgi:hypothetical protein